MPRPKVRPEDRQRAVKACIPCKASKKRCDAQQPCSNCVRKKAEETCEYAESMVRPRGIHAHTARAASVQQSSTTTTTNTVEREHDGDTSTRSPIEEVAYESSPAATATGKRKRSPARGSGQRRSSDGRLLLNSRGEKVYVGGTASLSFLQFLRQTIKQQMGPSVFTDNDRRNVMLEVRSPEDTNAIFEEDESQKRALIEIYFAATNGFLDLFTRDEIEAYLTSVPTPTDGGREYALVALDLIIAIGGQCRALRPFDLRYAVRYFSRAQKAAVASALEDPCLNMVRCFLLMAFYMLGACRRNAAFMYVGIAAQASSALGLHVTEQYRNFTVTERSVRLRTLKSLRVLDVLVCSILGRTYSTPAVRIDSASFTGMHVQPGKPRDMALNASFGACELIAEIMSSVDGDVSNPIDTPTAKRFLERLRSWSANLPLEIRRFEKAGDEPITPSDQECIIGSIHVSCVYYFAVMLVTRPFLITHLMARLPGAPLPVKEPKEGARVQDSEAVNLAQACIDSAILMAQTCFDALQGGILLQNMCIMKAWVFAAGLVLGFSMFAQGESPFDMDESFNGAREVLKKLAEHSPQAEHYYEILTGFADAIQRHRQHLSREKRRASNKYVNRILSLDVNVGTHNNNNTATSVSGAASQVGFSPGMLGSRDKDTADSSYQLTDLGSMAAEAANGGGDSDVAQPLVDTHIHADGQTTPFQLLGTTPQFAVDTGGGFDFGLFGWDNFAMQISENFSFDNYGDTWGPAE
ncbi:uncharacterized protein PV06_06239 [Exophiala oligosperma]|uniref:Zn(2)-C6 fungal-type domain-containing protein n=2 Tax=Chaetothyriales TaxID=34395 RepID=A0A0D2E4I9_9EURO|nr:uncharacterized protein PV06_06239 [Exophiala oligosperma]KAJ9617811.1 hypothetical protein H2204_013394 [Knufia peltigerae]KIW42719.1 hypothetical protein PV06_06239 [Exophiala oligosperma]